MHMQVSRWPSYLLYLGGGASKGRRLRDWMLSFRTQGQTAPMDELDIFTTPPKSHRRDARLRQFNLFRCKVCHQSCHMTFYPSTAQASLDHLEWRGRISPECLSTPSDGLSSSPCSPVVTLFTNPGPTEYGISYLKASIALLVLSLSKKRSVPLSFHSILTLQRYTFL